MNSCSPEGGFSLTTASQYISVNITLRSWECSRHNSRVKHNFFFYETAKPAMNTFYGFNNEFKCPIKHRRTFTNWSFQISDISHKHFTVLSLLKKEHVFVWRQFYALPDYAWSLLPGGSGFTIIVHTFSVCGCCWVRPFFCRINCGICALFGMNGLTVGSVDHENWQFAGKRLTFQFSVTLNPQMINDYQPMGNICGVGRDLNMICILKNKSTNWNWKGRRVKDNMIVLRFRNRSN